MSKPNEGQLKRLAAALLTLNLLSGCVRYSQTVRLKQEKSVLIIHRSAPSSVSGPAFLPEEPTARLTLGEDEHELPVPAADLIAAGWQIDARYDREKAAPGSFTEGVIFSRDGEVIRAVVGNPSRPGDILLRDGLIIGLTILPQGTGPAPDFSLDGGIAPGLASSEVIARLGQPKSEEKAGPWKRLKFTLPGQSLEIYLDRQDQVAGIRLLNTVPLPDRNEGTGHLRIGPPFWGEDPTTGRILVDGEFFRIPGRASQFFTSGWSVARGLPSLMPGSESLVQFKKGSYRISVGVRNPGEKIIELADSEVFSVRATSPEMRLPVQLAHSLKTGISHDQALGFASIYKPRKKESGDLIWYEIIRKDFEIRLVIDARSDTLISIELKRFRSPWETDRPPLPAPVRPGAEEVIP